jgi:hypothetical protein
MITILVGYFDNKLQNPGFDYIYNSTAAYAWQQYNESALYSIVKENSTQGNTLQLSNGSGTFQQVSKQRLHRRL